MEFSNISCPCTSLPVVLTLNAPLWSGSGASEEGCIHSFNALAFFLNP